jgi:hypothetical protein
MKVDRDVAERAAPFNHCCIEVRMRYTDSLQATERIDQGDGRRVQHRNAVPQDISIGCGARTPLVKKNNAFFSPGAPKRAPRRSGARIELIVPSGPVGATTAVKPQRKAPLGAGLELRGRELAYPAPSVD